MSHFQKKARIALLLLLSSALLGCAASRPRDPENICAIFREKSDWYGDARRASQRWGIPIPVMMAIMYHESGYHPKARPPRTTCLFFFPGPRPSSAYGYPQAVDSTWEWYQTATDKAWADRDAFDDAIDFIGWYCHVSRRKCKIAPHDAYRQYLAYHEGHGGYLRGSYHKKPGLKRAAAHVDGWAERYSAQLSRCEAEFREKGGGCLWPF